MTAPEIIFLPSDINVCCVTASSFPAGIAAAHEALHRLFADEKPRAFYGISWADQQGNIIYKAAAGESEPGEFTAREEEKFIIRKGHYIGLLVKDFRHHPQKIKLAFDELLKRPEIDPAGYCLEIYKEDNSVQCLVGLGSLPA